MRPDAFAAAAAVALETVLQPQQHRPAAFISDILIHEGRESMLPLIPGTVEPSCVVPPPAFGWLKR